MFFYVVEEGQRVLLRRPNGTMTFHPWRLEFALTSRGLRKSTSPRRSGDFWLRLKRSLVFFRGTKMIPK